MRSFVPPFWDFFAHIARHCQNVHIAFFGGIDVPEVVDQLVDMAGTLWSHSESLLLSLLAVSDVNVLDLARSHRVADGPAQSRCLLQVDLLWRCFEEGVEFHYALSDVSVVTFFDHTYFAMHISFSFY